MNENELQLSNDPGPHAPLAPAAPVPAPAGQPVPVEPSTITESAGKPVSDTLVVVSKVKAYLSDAKMRCAGDVADALTVEIKRLLDNAVRRCQARGRGTVQGVDI